MAGVATAHPLLLDNTRENSTEKRKKREEKEGAHKRKTSPTPLPRELERDARGLEKQSGKGWVTRRSGLLALWPLGCGTGSCLLFKDTEPLVELVHLYPPDSPLGESGSCLALRTLTSLGLVWPSGPLTSLGLVWPSGL